MATSSLTASAIIIVDRHPLLALALFLSFFPQNFPYDSWWVAASSPISSYCGFGWVSFHRHHYRCRS
jgi:hypothetical protein